MALTMNSDAQSLFYEKLFGLTHPVTQQVKNLIALGFTFETTLYECKAKFQTVPFSVSLPNGTSSLMKGTVSPVFVQQSKNLIETWVKQMAEKATFVSPAANIMNASVPEHVVVLTGYTGNLIVLIKVIRQITGLGLAQAKAMAEGVIAGVPVNVIVLPTHEQATIAMLKLSGIGASVKIQSKGAAGQSVKTSATFNNPESVKVTGEPVFASKPKPVPSVVPLRQAAAIGQKVKGTSNGSVYYCVAVGEHVRLAARIHKGGTISIRAEWDGTPTEDLKKLQESGLQMKGGYGSMHLDAQGVPHGRVIGSFVLGTGIEWKQIVMSSTELVVE